MAHSECLIPVGKHITLAMEKNKVYDMSRPYPNAWMAMAQATKDVWFRMDGGEPEENVGFKMKSGSPELCMAINDNWKLMTTKQNCIFQTQWMGRT